MKANKRYIVLFVVLFMTCLPSICRAQDDDISLDDFTSYSPDDFIKLQMPSINVLLANARLRPKIRAYDVQEKIQESILKKEKRGWTEFFNFGSNYNYGNSAMYSSYSDKLTPIISAATTGKSSSWIVGVSFSVGLSNLLDLKSRVRRQELNIEFAHLQTLQELDQEREDIINAYTDVNLELSVLKQEAESYVFAKTAAKMAEQDFITGKKTIEEIASVKQSFSQELTKYETDKATLIKSLFHLEIMTNTKIFKSK